MSAAAGDLLATRWTIENGLPQNTVRALCRTVDGYLWLGTRSGLVRFDGMRFHVLNHWNSPLLPSEEILSLLPAGDHGVWVGTAAGLVRFDGKDWQSHCLNGAASASMPIMGLIAAGDGSVWVGTSRGLFRMDAQGDCRVASGWPKGKKITCLATAPGSVLLLGTPDGEVFSMAAQPDARAKRMARIPGGIRNLVYWRGATWAAAETGLFRISEKSPPATKVTLPDASVPSALFPNPDGGLWVGTEGQGLLELDAAGVPKDFPPVPRGGAVLSLLLDFQGNLWAGTEVSGLVRIRRRAVRGLATEVGLVTAVMESSDGTLWAATRRRGVIRLDMDGSGSGEPLPVSPQGLCLDLPDEKTVWVGTAGNGLLRLTRPGGERSWFLRDLAVSIRAVLAGTAGLMWVATDGGLYRKDNDFFVPMSLPGGAGGNGVTVLLSGDAGQYWAGGDGGVWRFAGERWTLLAGTERYPAPRSVTTMFRDKRGLLWVGTRGWGLFAYFEGKWVHLREAQGLADNYVMAILEDGRGYLWCGCHRGLFRIMEKDLPGLLKQKNPRIDCMVWNEAEGMPNSECTGEAQPSAWKTAGGRLLFSTVRGLAVVDPAMAPKAEPRMPVRIETVLADNRALDPESPASLPGRVEMLEFYFTYPDLVAPEKVVFRYRLKGFSDQWTVSNPGQERTALYLNLGPGLYEFQAQARGGSGFWSPINKTFALRIRRRPRYIYLLPLLLVIGGGVLVFRMRNKKPPVQPKYQTSGLTDDVAEKKLKDLLEIMREEKPFLEADLTLGKLAKRIGLHQNYLSRIINEKRQQSFNDFINQYRIEEARQRLADPRWKNATILQIAYETGFYSKSVFNTAFKKFTGLTPSAYRRDPSGD